MTKKDINFIKLTKRVVRDEQIKANNQFRLNEYRRMESLALASMERETEHTIRCKEAAKMSPRERLMNYAATMDGTYIGVGCDWDLLTTLGKNQKFGGL
jgi:hypothetical protein